VIREAHSDDTYHGKEDAPEHAAVDDEVDVMARAGDLIVGDARLLHAAHSNRTDEARTLITLWYIPTYAHLSEALRSAVGGRYATTDKPLGWPDEDWDRVLPLVPIYEGDVEPLKWNRIPGEQLG